MPQRNPLSRLSFRHTSSPRENSSRAGFGSSSNVAECLDAGRRRPRPRRSAGVDEHASANVGAVGLFHLSLFLLLGLTWKTILKPAGEEPELLRVVELVAKRDTPEGRSTSKRRRHGLASGAGGAGSPGPADIGQLLGGARRRRSTWHPPCRKRRRRGCRALHRSAAAGRRRSAQRTGRQNHALGRHGPHEGLRPRRRRLQVRVRLRSLGKHGRQRQQGAQLRQTRTAPQLGRPRRPASVPNYFLQRRAVDHETERRRELDVRQPAEQARSRGIRRRHHRRRRDAARTRPADGAEARAPT